MKINYYNRQNKGITLIALVITIIVLLILAAVTILALSGDNGILKNATEAKKNTEEAGKNEIGALYDLEDQIDTGVSGKENLWTGTVNKPLLETGMIPVKYVNGQNGQTGNWVVCTEDDPEWYNYKDQEAGEYGNSKWANVMLSDGTYKTSLNNYRTDGTTIVAESELGSMFVWIPRFAYSIEGTETQGYHTSKEGTIRVEFLRRDTDKTLLGRTMDNELGAGKWNVHPAFNYGSTKLQGIWVAKFEASESTGSKVKVLPGVQSWIGISVSGCYTNCINMNSETNASYYGVTTDKNRVDPHLMKNSEWGAVAYLTQSSYGRNGVEVSVNQCGNYYTGTGRGLKDGSDKGNQKGTNQIYNSTYGWNSINAIQKYNGAVGKLSSTTGNETGIYDLSGGTWEYVAAYVNNGSNNIETGSTLRDSQVAAHREVYTSGETGAGSGANYEQMEQKSYEKLTTYGDALLETSSQGSSFNSWFSDGSYFPVGDYPFFIRGGSFLSTSDCGIFCFNPDRGGGVGPNSFRPVLAVF